MSTNDKVLIQLAGRLASRRASILECVQELITRDPAIHSSVGLSHQAFLDHLPKLLENLEMRVCRPEPVRAQDALERVPAQAHGEQRWEQGYSLVETMDEWRHVYACVRDELLSWLKETPDISAETALIANSAVTAFIEEGMRSSAHSYAERQRADASRRAAELQAALDEVKALERERVSSWRQALHDLRGTVGAISSASRLLQHPAASYEIQQRSHESLTRGLVGVREMLNELTTLARLEARVESLRVTQFDVSELLRELGASLQASAMTRGLILEIDGPKRLEVQGDAHKVHRIAQNLLQNALKYTDHGSVRLQWQPDITLPPEKTPSQWTLSVEDTGQGFRSPSVAQQVREEFGRMSESGPSEGLGLTIVRRLGDLLQARITIQASERGTVVRVTFPSSY